MIRPLKICVNVGLLIFLAYTLVMVILYFGLLWEKIVRPEIKNMNGEEVLLFGLLAMLLLGLDFLIARYLVRQLNKNNSP